MEMHYLPYQGFPHKAKPLWEQMEPSRNKPLYLQLNPFSLDFSLCPPPKLLPKFSQPSSHMVLARIPIALPNYNVLNVHEALLMIILTWMEVGRAPHNLGKRGVGCTVWASLDLVPLSWPPSLIITRPGLFCSLLFLILFTILSVLLISL